MPDSIGIYEIKVGTRRREQFGDIAELAASIAKHGLIQPIVIDAKDNLVAGERRLRACRELEWTEVSVRRLGDLTPIELREIELEENLRRKDLTAAEKSKLMVEQAEAAEQIVKQERKQAKQKIGESPPKNRRGRPVEETSERAVAQRMGVDKKTVRDAKQHKTAFDRYPFLEQPHWNQSSALEAFKALEALPQKDRDGACSMVNQPGTPPANALVMLRTLGIMEPKDRAAVLKDFESDDERRRMNAVCCAAQMPPMPDPRIVENEDILRRIAKAEKFGAATEYVIARESIESLQTKLRKEYDREAKALARRRGTA